MERISVNIFGDSYPLRVESREATEQAAREVEEIMQQFAGTAPDLEVKRFAVLAAIHFAEKKNELLQELETIERKVSRLNGTLDRTLG
ncbi:MULTISPECIES: cell division protein ZapA [Prosthecochloris]|uniref:Cell division protein ZapA n=1 Tax=Prosthecochloris vibrioformis TaxID=1098 RepID=A0A5C4RXI5_PROVB|nr:MULTISPECIES: cell division protein ZapA [Prosthecochloris]ANT65226.1 cell division protein ZapA [Prosthecochloris sp. CIB 2401]TNJ36006.1 cell division protein ZapA [Prosthecochloris vibrioformis]